MNSNSLKNLRRGGPGRPKGSKNKASLDIQAFSKMLLLDPQVQAKMLDQARRGKLPPVVIVTLMAYGFGKPKDTLEIGGAEGGPLTVIFQARPQPQPVALLPVADDYTED